MFWMCLYFLLAIFSGINDLLDADKKEKKQMQEANPFLMVFAFCIFVLFAPICVLAGVIKKMKTLKEIE